MQRCWSQFLPHLDADHDSLLFRFDEAMERLESRDQIPDTLARILSDEGLVHLRRGAFHMLQSSDMADDLYHVLVSTRYFFEAPTATPRILDCGAGIGLASYYFKTLYPEARITAIEPAPHLRTAARQNFKSTGCPDIELLPCVLSNQRGVQAFHLHPDRNRGGSLAEPSGQGLAPHKSINVRARPLSDLLRDPVDYLRLDVSGIESELLDEAELQLQNVAHLFVELHDTGSVFADRLARVFAILQRSGFETRVVATEDPVKRFSRGRIPEPRRRREALGIWARRNHALE